MGGLARRAPMAWRLPIGGRAGAWRDGAIDAALVIAACAWSFLFFLGRPMNHDVAWYLVSARRWIDGAVLYRDILEVNPPLAYYEVAAVLKLPLADEAAYLLGLNLLIAASCLWSRRLVALSGALSPRFATLVTAVALLIVPFTDFGQREQVALAAAMPYLWALALQPRLTAVERVALGVLAFLGFGLKPHFLAIPAGATLAAAVHRRSLAPLLDPANLALGLLCVAYAALVVIAFPAYLGWMVPTARLTYFAYGMPAKGVFIQPVFLIALPLIILGLRAKAPVAIWSGALAGAVLAYLVQFKGWSYHQIPIGGIGLVTGALMLAMREGARMRASAIVAAIAIVVCFLPATQGAYHYNTIQRQLSRELTGTRSALIVGENVWLAYPIVERQHIAHASRYSAMWPLPGAYRIATSETGARAAAARRILAETRTDIVTDFVAAMPEALVIDARAYKPYFKGGFDYVAFLSGDPRFGPAFARYRKTGRVGWLDVYRRR